MKTKVYVQKAVEQWRSMFACGEDTTLDDHNDPANPTKKQTTKSSKSNSKSKISSTWLRQMTDKLAEYGNIERMDTDSTTGSHSEESPVPVQVIETIQPMEKKAATRSPIETMMSNLPKAPSTTPTKTKKTRPHRRKKRLGPKEFYQTAAIDLGYDAEEENESEQDVPSNSKTAQDKNYASSIQEDNDYGPSFNKKQATTSQSLASHDAFSISVLTMKEFDDDGNFTADVIRKDHDYNAQKFSQMVKGIDIKSSVARVRHYKRKQAEQQQRLELDEMRREQEEILQKQLLQNRREQERKEQEQKLQRQLQLQKKRDQEKQLYNPDKWEDEYSLDGQEDSLNYSISTKSHYTTGVLQPSGTCRLAPPSRIVLPLALREEEDHLLSLKIVESSDEQDAPSDEEDEPNKRTRKTRGSFSLVPAKLESSPSNDEWESFEGGHVFHMGLGKKYYTQWGHYKSSGFKRKNGKNKAKDSVNL